MGLAGGRQETRMRAACCWAIMAGVDPVADARALVAERFAAARGAFLGAGVLSERRTATSDLDIVVLGGTGSAPYRESLRWRDWPAEVFVQDEKQIGAWFAKDRARRRPTLARMCADGEILIDVEGAALAVRDQALAVLAAGPPPLDEAERDRRRYGLTDLLDDLAGSTDQGETLIIGWNVLVQTAELALLLAGAWLGTGKWLLRELRAIDPRLADDLLAAHDQPSDLAVLADRVLASAGGALWAGYRQQGKL
jgi:hypothetical protein